ncbi:DUF1365 domain-containing protein [Nocardia acidivorans]|uniref:DUF1365 domain-containing protein n=1 Tax=Nocardia acidivorans TaxID=404580 RepID=UPI0008373240|nr:DUF1365 domain-containing protein [Nocardia acidivorans]
MTGAPALYLTRIRHSRRAPVRHEFEYRGYSWYFDIENPPAVPIALRPLVSFRARDHLTPGTGDTLRDRVDDFLAGHGVHCHGRITALMNARALGYVFDPLTVFWCHNPAGEVQCVIAEVHNTYGERHAYLLRTDELGRAAVDKRFYVSPFNEVDGYYLLRLPEPGDTVALSIALRRDGQPPFLASMRGHRVPVSTRTVLRAQVRTPLAPWLIAARIRRQGIALWARGVPIAPRPLAESTRRTAP